MRSIIIFCCITFVSTASISLWSSRLLSVDETSRLSKENGVFHVMRGVVTRGIASRITIVSSDEASVRFDGDTFESNYILFIIFHFLAAIFKLTHTHTHTH